MTADIEPGDHVRVGHTGDVDWVVTEIKSRVDPLGVSLRSGLTDRHRIETFGNLVLVKKGVTE